MKGATRLLALISVVSIGCPMSKERSAEVEGLARSCGAVYEPDTNQFFDCLRNHGVDPLKECWKQRYRPEKGKVDCDHYGFIGGADRSYEQLKNAVRQTK
jgi:hypothetical protein